jgi:hypothetical protein
LALADRALRAQAEAWDLQTALEKLLGMEFDQTDADLMNAMAACFFPDRMTDKERPRCESTCRVTRIAVAA